MKDDEIKAFIQKFCNQMAKEYLKDINDQEEDRPEDENDLAIKFVRWIEWQKC